MNAEMKPRYKQTELGEIPDDWIVQEVQALASVRGGKRLPLGGSLVAEDTGHPYIRVTDMVPGGVDARNIQYVPEDVFPQIKNYRIFIDDIFISVAGTLGIVGKIPHELDGANLTENADRITAITCNRDFLLYNLMSPRIQGVIESEKTVGAQPKLALGRIESFQIAIPPNGEEQKAIASALSDMDALISSMDQLIAKKRDIQQAAMQQLLTGQRRLPGFSGEWEVKRLGDCLLANPDYGINAPAVAYSDALPTYIRITDINDDGYFAPLPRVSVDSPMSSDYLLEEGDIVFARTGASVGKSYHYRADDGPLVFAGFLIRVRPNQGKLTPAFLAASIATESYWNWVRLMSMRSGQPGINSNEYASLPLQLPSIEEQTAIATIVTNMNTELAALKTRRDKARQLKQGMMQELLTGRIRLV